MTHRHGFVLFVVFCLAIPAVAVCAGDDGRKTPLFHNAWLEAGLNQTWVNVGFLPATPEINSRILETFGETGWQIGVLLDHQVSEPLHLHFGVVFSENQFGWRETRNFTVYVSETVDPVSVRGSRRVDIRSRSFEFPVMFVIRPKLPEIGPSELRDSGVLQQDSALTFLLGAALRLPSTSRTTELEAPFVPTAANVNLIVGDDIRLGTALRFIVGIGGKFDIAGHPWGLDLRYSVDLQNTIRDQGAFNLDDYEPMGFLVQDLQTRVMSLVLRRGL